MAQSIKNLSVGAMIKDSKGNIFTVIAKNHYASNQVTLWHTNLGVSKAISDSLNVSYSSLDYGISDVDYYLNSTFYKVLDNNLVNYVVSTNISYTDIISRSQYQQYTISRKYFLLSANEMGINMSNQVEATSVMPYFDGATTGHVYWTRTEYSYVSSGLSYFSTSGDQYLRGVIATKEVAIAPAFNVNTNLLVSDDVSNGYYSFVFNSPPVISTISNINGSYGVNTTITYTATDSDDTSLTHYISFNNGSTWSKINPTRVNNKYTYVHVFNSLGTYNCRIKVVDSAKNETVSNMFTVKIASVNPTVDIVSVIDKVITFKANCTTEEISKVEIIINGTTRKTFTSGFGFNLIYEINSSDLINGDNTIQIKATSTANLTGTKDLEVSKKTYNLPPVGTKVLINNTEYSIVNASSSGSIHTYQVDKNLVNNVKVNDIIKVMQDKVVVKCALSNISTGKDYEEMKLVKSKALKGNFEGYTEEKYELEGEGRYSTIKLELERFNTNIGNEIIELQQTFDYLED